MNLKLSEKVSNLLSLAVKQEQQESIDAKWERYWEYHENLSEDDEIPTFKQWEAMTKSGGQGYTPRNTQSASLPNLIVLDEPQTYAQAAAPDVAALQSQIGSLQAQCAGLIIDNLALTTENSRLKALVATQGAVQPHQQAQTAQSGTEPRIDAVTNGFLRGHYKNTRQALIDRQNAKRAAVPFRK